MDSESKLRDFILENMEFGVEFTIRYLATIVAHYEKLSYPTARENVRKVLHKMLVDGEVQQTSPEMWMRSETD